MSKFNVGDKVRVVKFNSFTIPAWIGTTGTVRIVGNGAWDYYVDLDTGESEEGFDEEELELVEGD